VQRIRDINQEAEYPCEQAHSHDYFEIIWVVRGTGTHWVDMQKWDIDDNRIFCIKPGQMHNFIPGDNTEGFVISFTESFLNLGELEFDLTCQTNLFQLFLKTNGIKIRNDVQADMNEIILKMMKENDNVYLFKTEIIKRYLRIFLIYLSRQFDQNLQAVIQSRNMEIVQNFMKLLEKNFKTRKMVTEYAGDLCVTPNYLNEIIKKMTGYSAGHQIRQRVVLEAKRMALYSDISMKEIAYELGFLDSGHFSKFFKAVTGKNFSDFKKQKVAFSLELSSNQ
jgi:AraC family transcriptional activator of pobA